MSFDRQIREGLQRAADADHGADVERSLSLVRNRRRRRVRSRRAAAAVAVTALVTAAATGVPTVLGEWADRRDVIAAPPADALGLPGTFAVDVDESPLAAQHGMAGRWIIELRADDSIHVEPPPTFEGPTSGISYRAEGDTVLIDAFVSDPLCTVSQTIEPVGTYRWTRTVDTLELAPVSETCDARRLLFAGQSWEVLS